MVYAYRACAQSKALYTRRMKRYAHTNCPIQVCSLTTSDAVVQDYCGLTRGDKVARREIHERRTPRQSERRGKQAGRRKTNDCRHRKGKSPDITVRGDDFGEVERAFDSRRPKCEGKKLDESTHATRGVKGGDMSGKSIKETGEAPRVRRESGVNRSTRRKAEKAGVNMRGESETPIVVRIRWQHKQRGAKGR